MNQFNIGDKVTWKVNNKQIEITQGVIVGFVSSSPFNLWILQSKELRDKLINCDQDSFLVPEHMLSKE